MSRGSARTVCWLMRAPANRGFIASAHQGQKEIHDDRVKDLELQARTATAMFLALVVSAFLTHVTPSEHVPHGWA